MVESSQERIPQRTNEQAAPMRQTERESKLEQASERQRSADEQAAAAVAAKIRETAGARPAIMVTAKDPELKAIEDILAEGLEEFFLNLPPSDQQSFKRTGEETAQKIRIVIRKKTSRIKDIVALIAKWLKALPGINRFFLEQEAKIKADKIVQRFRL